MSEYVDFHYMPLEGKITGKQVLQQTEDAINDLGNKVYNLDIDENRIDEAVEKSEQAIETADSALSAVTTDRAVWKNTVTEMKATDIDLGVTAATRGKMVFNDGNGAFYGVRSEKSGDVDSDDTVFLDNGNVAERIQSMNIIAKGNNIIFVANVAELIDSDALIGNVYGTAGYYSANDGGAGLYSIRTKTQSDVEDGGSIIFLDNGNVAELITDVTVNVKQFGAKGNGVDDDTTCFQNALNFADTVVVPNGTYLLESQVSMGKDNQKLLAQGDVTIICNSTTAVFYAQDLDNLEIAGFYFKGTVNGTTKQSDNGIIDIHTCTNVNVHNNRFKDIPFAYCIWFRYCEHVQALYNHIDTYYYSGIMAGNSTSYAVINHNTVLNGYYNISGNRYPICIGGYNGELSPFPVLSHNNEAGYNYVEDTTALWEGIDTHGGRNIWIHDNYVKGTNNGISVVDSPQTTDNGIYNILIENNIVELGDNYDASATGHNEGICVVSSGENVVITNNVVKTKKNANATLTAAVRIGGRTAGALSGVNFSNNIIDVDTTGIRFDSKIVNADIANNSILIQELSTPSIPCINCNTSYIARMIIHDNLMGSISQYSLREIYRDMNGQTGFGENNPIVEYNNRMFNYTTRSVGCTYWLLEYFTLNPNTHLNVGQKGNVIKNLYTTNNAEWVCIQDADVANNIKGVWIGRNQKSVTASTSVTPKYIGEICVKDGIVYVATGLTTSDWVQISN